MHFRVAPATKSLMCCCSSLDWRTLGALARLRRLEALNLSDTQDLMGVFLVELLPLARSLRCDVISLSCYPFSHLTV